MTVLAIEGGNKKGSSGKEPAAAGHIEEIKRWLADHKNSRTPAFSEDELGRAIGCSGSAVGNFLRGTYGADESVLANKVGRYRDRFELEQKVGGAAVFLKTSQARTMQRVIRTAEALRGFGLIAAAAGMGKTRVLLEAKRERNNVPMYVRFTRLHDTKWALINHLLFVATKDSRRRTSPAHAYNELVDYLLRSPRPVYLDEIQCVEGERLEIIRSLLDDSGCPFVLAGNLSIYERGAGRGSDVAAHTQFTSRVADRCLMDAKDLTTADVRMVARQFAEQQLVAECLDELHAAACAGGAFRLVEFAIKDAKVMADALGEDVGRTHILAAISKRAGYQ